MAKSTHSENRLEHWLTLLMEGRALDDPDAGAIVENAKIIVCGTRPGAGVSTKCASLRRLAEEKGDDISILDAGVISETLLENLKKQDPFTGCILITHRGADANTASRWMTGLGAATRASYMAARYPWQADDDLMQGREDILKMLDEAVYRHVLGQLPSDAPEIKALQEFADSLRKKK